MVTSTVIRRVKKYNKTLQVRLPNATEAKLQRMSLQTGVDKSVIVRLALNHGLSALAKSLPAQVE